MVNYPFLRLSGEPAMVLGPTEEDVKSFNLRNDWRESSPLVIRDFDSMVPGRVVRGLLCHVLCDMGHYMGNSQGLMLIISKLSLSKNVEDVACLEFASYLASTIRALLPTAMKVEQTPFIANRDSIEKLLGERYTSFVRDLPFEHGAVGLYGILSELHERRPNEDTKMYLERSRRVVEIIHYLTHLPSEFTFDEMIVHPNGMNPILIPEKVELQL